MTCADQQTCRSEAISTRHWSSLLRAIPPSSGTDVARNPAQGPARRMCAWWGSGFTNDGFGVDLEASTATPRSATGSHTFSRRGGRPSFAAHCTRARSAPTAPPQLERMQPVCHDWPGWTDDKIARSRPHTPRHRRPGRRPSRSRRRFPDCRLAVLAGTKHTEACSDRSSPGARRVLRGLAGHTLGRR